MGWLMGFSMLMNAVGGGLSAGIGSARNAYKQKNLKSNAIINRALAKDAVSRGQQAEQFKRMEMGQFESSQRAAFGGSGVDVDTGSAARVQADTSAMADIEALMIRENYEREAQGYEQAAAQNLRDAEMLDEVNPYQKAATLLGSGTSVASQWYNMSK